MLSDLKATSRLIQGDCDPYRLAAAGGALFDGRGTTIGTWGVAATLPLRLSTEREVDAALSQLGAISHDGDGGGVLAIGALPFDPTSPGALIVPAVIVRYENGHSWWTTVVDGVEPDEPTIVESPDLVGVEEIPDGADYVTAVADAVDRIANKVLEKVVLARTVRASFTGPIPADIAVRRLRASEPTCTTFSIPVVGGRFIGASPELLLSRRGSAICSHPLAGTVAADDAGALSSTPKIAREHQLVVDDVAALLRPSCTTLSVPSVPSAVRLGTVAHLGTRIEGTLLDPPPSALHLAALLHPTPAVGGSPRSAALACITELELATRGYWAGPVGWVDATGDGDWVIGIRSALLCDDIATLSAGAGIVEGSDPAAELKETTAKLAPILDALFSGSADRL